MAEGPIDTYAYSKWFYIPHLGYVRFDYFYGDNGFYRGTGA